MQWAAIVFIFVLMLAPWESQSKKTVTPKNPVKQTKSKKPSKKSSKTQSFVPKSFSADFVQEFKSSLSGKIKKSEGKIDYKYPSNIRLEMEGKSPLTFVSNPDKTWYYRPPFEKGQPGELKIGATTENSLSKFFDMLKNGLDSNKDYEVKKKDNEYDITFKEDAAKKIKVKSAVLVFKKDKKHDFSEIEKIHLSYTNKKKVTMVLSELKVGATFSTNHFTFFPPKNTRVAN
jgi:outer membrane lipoprotein carrier protein